MEKEHLKKLLSFGNMKVGNDTAIFNMNPAFRCPSEELGLCVIASKCYAKKAERMYPGTSPYRERQELYWDSIDADTFADEFIQSVSKKKNPIKYLRVSESGDFKGQSDVDKLSDIANQLGKHNIVVYTYTARKDLDFSKKSKNLIVNGSGFMVSNNFYIIKEKEDKSDKFLCPGGCLKCNLCKEEKSRNIAVLEH